MLTGIMQFQNIYILNEVGYFSIEILSKGLLNEKDELLKKELLELIPADEVDQLLKQIKDLSDIKQEKEKLYKLTKELMGF